MSFADDHLPASWALQVVHNDQQYLAWWSNRAFRRKCISLGPFIGA